MSEYERGFRAGIDAAARVADGIGAASSDGIAYRRGRLDAAEDIAEAIRALPAPDAVEATDEDVTVEVDPIAFEHWWQTRQLPDLRHVAIEARLITAAGGMLSLTEAGRELRKRGESLRARSQP